MAGRIDYEAVQRLNVTVRASDQGNPPRSSEREFSIAVININDHTPKFSQPFYEAEILENSTVRQSVVTVQASDLDLSPYGDVKYVERDYSSV